MVGKDILVYSEFSRDRHIHIYIYIYKLMAWSGRTYKYKVYEKGHTESSISDMENIVVYSV